MIIKAWWQIWQTHRHLHLFHYYRSYLAGTNGSLFGWFAGSSSLRVGEGIFSPGPIGDLIGTTLILRKGFPISAIVVLSFLFHPKIKHTLRGTRESRPIVLFRISL